MQLWSWTRSNALHYLLHCNLYYDLRTERYNDICALNSTFKNLSHEKLLNILLYRSEGFSFNTNKKIKPTIKFLKTSKRFIDSLLTFYITKNIEWTNSFKDYIRIPFQRLHVYIYAALECKRTYDLFWRWVRYRVGFFLLSCIYVDVCEM